MNYIPGYENNARGGKGPEINVDFLRYGTANSTLKRNKPNFELLDQGSRQVFKVGDKLLKEPDAKGACYLRDVGACSPREFFKIEYSETLFPGSLEPENQFPRRGWSSLKFLEMMS